MPDSPGIGGGTPGGDPRLDRTLRQLTSIVQSLTRRGEIFRLAGGEWTVGQPVAADAALLSLLLGGGDEAGDPAGTAAAEAILSAFFGRLLASDPDGQYADLYAANYFRKDVYVTRNSGRLHLQHTPGGRSRGMELGSSDDGRLRFTASDQTPYIYLLIQPGTPYFGVDGGASASIGFQCLNAANVIFGSSSTTLAAKTQFGVRPSDGAASTGTLHEFWGDAVTLFRNSALTNTAPNELIVDHRTTGTPAAGFGTTRRARLQSSTTTSQEAFAEEVTWATATHASRSATVKYFIYDTSAHEFLRATPAETTFNEDGEDRDTRIEGNTDANLLFADAGNDRVGIGTASPAAKHDVSSGQEHVLRSAQAGSTGTADTYQTALAFLAGTDTLWSLTPTASKTYLVQAFVTARRASGAAGAADDGSAYVVRSMFTTKAGTVTQGGGSPQADFADEDDANTACTLDTDGTDVRLRVTTPADTSYLWTARVVVDWQG